MQNLLKPHLEVGFISTSDLPVGEPEALDTQSHSEQPHPLESRTFDSYQFAGRRSLILKKHATPRRADTANSMPK
jgi:hypothetical protein